MRIAFTLIYAWWGGPLGDTVEKIPSSLGNLMGISKRYFYKARNKWLLDGAGTGQYDVYIKITRPSSVWLLIKDLYGLVFSNKTPHYFYWTILDAFFYFLSYLNCLLKALKQLAVEVRIELFPKFYQLAMDNFPLVHPYTQHFHKVKFFSPKLVLQLFLFIYISMSSMYQNKLHHITSQLFNMLYMLVRAT